MITEGTRINRTENITEYEIEEKVIKEIHNSQGLVVVNLPVRDLDRLVTFYNAAKGNWP